MPVLESRLVISAEDKTQAAFDAIEARIKRLSQTVASADRAVGKTGLGVAAGRNAALAARGTGGLGSSIAAVAGGSGRNLSCRSRGRGGDSRRRVSSTRTARMAVAGESPRKLRRPSRGREAGDGVP